MTEPTVAAGYVAVSQEVLDDAAHLSRTLTWALHGSPEDRVRWAEQLRRAAERRATERAQAPTATLTLESLLAALDWSQAYAEHVVQPYCTCGPDRDDGWSLCEHAGDLGLAP